ncbi:hypothetical protein B0H19DRAFT_1018794 [Mycena capillaripes]|nr:hypothetical protein B0H19DRAFT_1018794 [Mycena capillaripes]
MPNRHAYSVKRSSVHLTAISMDPFSLATGIAGLVSLAAQIGSSLAEFQHSYRGARESYARLSSELTAMSNTLSILHLHLKKGAPDIGPATFLQERVDQCRATLEEIFKECIPNKPMTKRRRLVWAYSDERRITDFIAILERYKSMFSLALELDLSGQVDRLQLGITQLLLGHTSDRQEAAIEKDEELLEKIVEWLNPLPMDARLAAILQLRQPGTCQWVLDNPLFEAWKESPSGSFLWLNGIPGNGKTVITAVLMDHLVKNRSPDDAVVYAFCEFRDKQSVDPVAILRTFLAELLRLYPGKITPDFDDLINDKKKGRSPPHTISHLDKLIRRAAQRFLQVHLILDGLDECENRESSGFLDLLPALVSDEDCAFKVFVASRREPDIQDAFRSAVTISLQMEQWHVYDDIVKHINGELKRRRKLARLSKKDKDEIRTTLVEKASGMFRLVQCHLDLLADEPNHEGRMGALRTLPSTLFDMYDHILKRIPKQKMCIARRALRWLADVKRPIRLKELAEAIRIEFGDAGLNTRCSVSSNVVILEALSSLVIYDAEDHRTDWSDIYDEEDDGSTDEEAENHSGAEDGNTDEDVEGEDGDDDAADDSDEEVDSDTDDDTDGPGDGIITLSHMSVREYLEEEHLLTEPALEYYHLPAPSVLASHMFALLLDFVLVDAFDRPLFETEDELHQFIEKHPFYDYATHFSEDYIGSVDITQPTTLEAILRFIRSHCEAAHSLRQQVVLTSYDRFYRSVTFNHPIRWLISNGINPAFITHIAALNLSTDLIQCALFGSIRYKHTQIMENLLDFGAADVNHKHTCWHCAHLVAFSISFVACSPLVYAFEMGNLVAARVLLQRGAFPGAAMVDGWTPLHSATQSGLLEAVNMLLAHPGVDVHARDWKGQTAYMIATLMEAREIIQSLVDHGASQLDLFVDTPHGLPEEEVMQVGLCLAQMLRAEVKLVPVILDLAECWVVSSAARNDPDGVAFRERSPDEPYVSLKISGGSKAPLRRLLITTTSHDQGWSSHPSDIGTYRNSSSWFEVGNRRTGSRQVSHNNLHGSDKKLMHQNLLAHDSSMQSISDWMETFRGGDVVEVYAKARYPGWANHVYAVEVVAYTAW